MVTLCFFLSGIAGIIFETVWARAFGLILGNSLQGISVVVGLFLGGLGVGAALAARLVRRLPRPIATYAWVEGAIGLWGLIGIPLLPRIPGFLVYVLPQENPGAWGPVLARVLAALLFLAPPTLLMGATLPLLSEGLSRRGRFLPSLGLLYGVNTLGAFVGAVLAGFVLLPHFGSARTAATASGVNFAILLVAGLLQAASRAGAGSRWAVPAPQDPGTGKGEGASPVVDAGSLTGPLLGLLFAAAGALALAAEIAWTRGLALVLGSSTYTFSLILAVFLAGAGAGSLLWRLRRRDLGDPVRAYGILWLMFALAVLLSMVALDRCADIYLRLYSVTYAHEALAVGGLFLVAAAVVFPPACLLGLHFPLTGEILHRLGGGAGRASGKAFSFNSLGSLVGSLSAGFLLLPALGTASTLRGVATLSLLLGGGLVAARGTGRVALRFLGFASLVAVAPWILAEGPDLGRLLAGQGIYRRVNPELARQLPPAEFASRLSDFGDRRCLFLEEGNLSTVAVWYGDGNLSMTVGGKVDASVGDMETQVLLGHLPMLFHPAPRKVFVVGYGSGITANSVMAHRPTTVEVAEIEPAVIRAAEYFRPWTPLLGGQGVLTNLAQDGRTALTYGNRRYDVIVSEPSNPWVAGVNALFTEDFYRVVRSRLEAGGIFCQWVQIYEMSPETHRAILRSLRAVFPHFVAFEVDGDLIYIARTESAPRLGPERWDSLEPAVRNDLAGVGIVTLEDLMVRALNDGSLELPPGAMNTDDNGLVEYRAPLELPAYLTAERSIRPQFYASSNPLDLWVRIGWPGPTDDSVRRAVDAALLWGSPGLARTLLDGWKGRGGAVPGDLERRVSALEALFAEVNRKGLVSCIEERMSRADRFGALGRNDEAADLLIEAAMMAPRERRVLLKLGTYLGSAGMSELVAEWAGRLIRRGNWVLRYEAFLLLGVARHSQGRESEAEEAFRRAIETDPFRESGYLYLVSRLSATGRDEEALAWISRGLHYLPHSRALDSLKRGLSGEGPESPQN